MLTRRPILKEANADYEKQPYAFAAAPSQVENQYSKSGKE
jgi:hypothetical protein